jgi:arginase
MAEIRLIVVPYELGRLRDGVGRGPERLLELGAEEALAASGARVETELIELSDVFSNEIDASFALIRRIAELVRAARGDQAFPVVLSGSCIAAAVGVVAGLDEAAPGVVWFDAHADFNDTETTPSGYLDGMGLAVLTGDAWQALLATVPGARVLPQTSVVLAGARDFDDAELRRLEASVVAHLPPERLRDSSALAGAVESLVPKPSGLYLHLDLDVIDLDEAPVNIYSAADGLTSAQFERLVGMLVADFPVHAASLTAYDPECDRGDRIPPIASRLLATLGERVGPRR